LASFKSTPLRLAAFGMFTPLLPLIVVQGRQVRNAMPKLADAHGPTSGTYGRPPARLRIVVLGESTVAGIGARTHTHSLPGRLAAALGGGLGTSVGWKAVGESGANARKASRLVDTGLAHGAHGARGERFDCAFVALGVNDVIERTPLARWKADVAAVADLLVARHDVRTVVLLGVPPMHRFPALPQPLRAFLGARAQELDEVLAVLAAERAELLHVPTPVDGPLEYFCADRFHPSEAGYAAWAAHTATAVAGVVAERAGLQSGEAATASAAKRRATGAQESQRAAANGDRSEAKTVASEGQRPLDRIAHAPKRRRLVRRVPGKVARRLVRLMPGWLARAVG
jgi:lysophospholipase L1-like esterase